MPNEPITLETRIRRLGTREDSITGDTEAVLHGSPLAEICGLTPHGPPQWEAVKIGGVWFAKAAETYAEQLEHNWKAALTHNEA
ncbi:MAG: hypothetical protein JWQ04_2778 [Pedosphaera sp.]|nr:hypothetical protein [Pedosphaera sp.]